MIIGFAEQDIALFGKLDAAAEFADGDEDTLEPRLNKLIDRVTRTRAYVDYGDAPDWAAEVDAALDVVAEIASGRHAGLALKLTERAIDRIAQASESIDDSDGHCGALLNRAGDIHLAAAIAARPDAVKLARDLFAREASDDFGPFEGAAERYAEVLGDSGLAEYHRLAAKAWDKLTSRAAGARESDDEPRYHQVKNILDAFAERAGDVDARIALRARDLSSAWSYLELAKFCQVEGRAEEALRWAEEGLSTCEDAQPDERLVFFAADLLVAAGRKSDALEHLQKSFKKRPTLELYLRLRKLGGTGTRESCLVVVEAAASTNKRKGWSGSGDLLVEIMMREKMLDEAWEAGRKHGVSRALKQELAKASEATHPDRAIEVYTEYVEYLAGASIYSEAAALVTRMAGLRSAAQQATYVADLRERHRRKRNFMKILR